jgi:nitronate monooxygenase
MLSTDLTRLLGIDVPIIQAGMGGDAGPALAAAVSNAGALGSMGTIGLPVEAVRTNIAELRALTAKPWALNLITFDWAPFTSQIVDLAIEERVPAVVLSFGDFRPALERCQGAELRTLVQVQDIAAARTAIAARADAVIVQGNEAGGHTGYRGTLAFAAQALDVAGDTPVVVAGGIGDGRGLAAALAMGAAGVVLGTRFKATEEFRATATQKQAIVASHGENTLAHPVFDAPYPFAWPEGIVGRAFKNAFSDEWAGREEDVRAQAAGRPPFALVMELSADPATEINWAGESSSLVHEVLPAAEVVRRIREQAESLLRTVTARVVSNR